MYAIKLTEEQLSFLFNNLENNVLDAQYHTINDTSWSNSRWCLEKTSDVLEAIRHANEF